jgi:U3 small nucleolar RNA-associated protein 18
LNRYHRVYPIPEWALPSNKRKSKKRRESDASSNSSEESDYGMEVEEVATEPLAKLLSTAGSSWTKKSIRLMPEKIEIARLQDANQARPSHSGISAVSFHPTHPLLLSAGLDSTVRLFHIDGKINPAATSLHLKKTPIRSAQFHAGGRKVFLSGRRRYFHVWDLESGAVEKVTQIGGAQNQELQRSTEKFKLSSDGRYMALAAARGVVNILDAKNCMWVTSAKVEGKVADMAWYPDGEGLVIASKGSEVIEFNMRTGTVESRWRDEGFGTTTIALGGKDSGRWCAIGSESGVVNVYDRINGLPNSGSGYTEIAPKPARVLEQLVTPVSLLEFSGDAQVLAMASHGKTDALRLVHLPSLSVYKNWPTSSTPLGRVNCAAWSPGTSNGMLAVGNEQGKVRLWEIR